MASGLGMEETELRLGLPGGCGEEAEAVKILGKRGFKQTLDLKLQLHTPAVTMKDEAQAAAEEEEEAEKPEKPPAPKAQVVGWPPVRSFRRNMISAQSEKGTKEGGGGNKSGIHSSNSAATTSFVKVSMAGAPYLRKVDLKTYRSYGELSVALQNMFLAYTTEYTATYEDKDEDWMLVGDVPWEMFVDSCKRLRIMKGSQASGLAPRAMDKSKDRS